MNFRSFSGGFAANTVRPYFLAALGSIAVGAVIGVVQPPFWVGVSATLAFVSVWLVAAVGMALAPFVLFLFGYIQHPSTWISVLGLNVKPEHLAVAFVVSIIIARGLIVRSRPSVSDAREWRAVLLSLLPSYGHSAPRCHRSSLPIPHEV